MAGSLALLVGSLGVLAWCAAVARAPGHPSVTQDFSGLGAGLELAFRADALALVILAFTAAGMATVAAGMPAGRDAAAWLVALAGLAELALASSALTGYAGWELSAAALWMSRSGRGRLVWLTLPASAAYLAASLGLLQAGGTAIFSFVPPGVLSVGISLGFLGAAVWRVATPMLATGGGALLQGALAVAAGGNLAARVYEAGDGRLPATWVGAVLCAAGTAVALAAGWRMASGSWRAAEAALVFGGLALDALGLGTPAGTAAAVLLLAAGLLLLPPAVVALRSGSGTARTVAVVTLAIVPGAATYLPVQVLVQAGAEAGAGFAFLSLAGVTGVLLAAYGALRDERVEFARVAGWVTAGGLAVGAAAAALPSAVIDGLAVPAAATVVRFPVESLAASGPAELSLAGGWPSGAAAIVLLVVVTATLALRRTRAGAERRALPAVTASAAGDWSQWVRTAIGPVAARAGNRWPGALRPWGSRTLLAACATGAVVVLIVRT